jgi:predicted ATPase
VVRQLPTMMLRATKSTGRQVLATTHASELLRDEALGVDEVLVLTPSDEGTTATLARDLPEVQRLLDNGYNLQEALNKALKPDSIGQLSFLKFA